MVFNKGRFNILMKVAESGLPGELHLRKYLRYFRGETPLEWREQTFPTMFT